MLPEGTENQSISEGFMKKLLKDTKFIAAKFVNDPDLCLFTII